MREKMSLWRWKVNPYKLIKVFKFVYGSIDKTKNRFLSPKWDNLLYTIESPEREWEVWSDIWPPQLWEGMKGSGRSEIVNVIWQHNWQRGHKKQHQQNNTSLHFRLPNIVIDLIILCIQISIFFLEVINLIGHLFPHTFHSESNNFILSNEEQYKVVRIYLHPQILVDSRL